MEGKEINEMEKRERCDHTCYCCRSMSRALRMRPALASLRVCAPALLRLRRPA